MTGSMNDFARLSEMNVGDAVKLDAGFDCGIAGKTLVVNEDDRGLFVACDEGRHYLDGQLADDGDHLVGVYPVEGETVEVWSTQTPALNGTALVVSTTPEPDSFELIVADLLPDDDDDGGEEPGAMYRRALANASASVDLIRQVAILVSGAEDAEDFERTYGHEDQASIRATAREIIQMVRVTPAPDQITLSRDQFTTALQEAAAQGMDHTSGPSCEEAASCRDVADDIVEAIDAGRFSPDTYVYAFMEEQRAIQRARQGAAS